MWNLKNDRKEFTIIWSTVKRAQAYVPGRNRCNLCTEKKLQIIKSKSQNQNNTRIGLKLSNKVQLLRMWEKCNAPTSKSYVNNIHATKGPRFRKLPSKKRHKPSRKKIKLGIQRTIKICRH